MRPSPMSAVELMLLIAGVSAVVILVTVTGFLLFRNFLNRERDRSEAFRSVHGKLDE